MTQPPALDWPARLALTVAGEVRRHRLAKGLSAQQLSDRCAAIGMPIQRSVLANLESGRRTTVNVAELLVLAHALSVPPGVLLFPVGYEVQTEMLPGAFNEPGAAVEWLAGRSFVDTEAADYFFDSPLGLVRLHQDQATILRRTLQMRDKARADFADMAQRFRAAEESYVRAETERMKVYSELDALGVFGSDTSGIDAEESKILFSRHEALSAERDAHADGARQYRYAAQRVDDLEREASRIEVKLLEIRDRMRNEGLVPPLLPRLLSYIDPGAPILEDIPKAKAQELPPSRPPSGDEWDAQITPTIPAVEEAPAPQTENKHPDEVRDVLEELKPWLADILERAFEEAVQRRREKEGE